MLVSGRVRRQIFKTPSTFLCCFSESLKKRSSTPLKVYNMTMENRPYEDVFVSSIKNAPPLPGNLRIWLTQSVLDEPAGKLKLRAMKKGPLLFGVYTGMFCWYLVNGLQASVSRLDMSCK